MKYLVYVSSATHEMSREELLEVLRVSRANNARRGITGMLLYKGGCFIQAIEGPEEAIDDLHRVIAADSRHAGMITMLQGSTDTRLFPDWSMGFKNIDRMDDEDLSAFTSFLEEWHLPEDFAERPHIVKKLLLSFRDSMSGAL